jgi:chloramphenicol O-acetyltransferase type A
MKQQIDLQTWSRKAHFDFFRKYDEPFHGICVDVDCERAYERAKALGTSFFLYYLYQSIKAVNETEALCYRLEGEEVFHYNPINVGTTVDRADGSFGFCYLPFSSDYAVFEKTALTEMEKVRSQQDLVEKAERHDLVYYSSLPWLKFTGLSHARHFQRRESIPKITFGKITMVNGRRQMPMSVHVHHALVDGRHVGAYVERFQHLLHL